MDISNISHADRSEVLVQALPYIQQYHNKTVVIKYGGNAMINKDLQDAVMTDIVLLRSVGVNVVLVHGGGPEISEMLKKIGKESRFVDGLRYTDEETVDVVQMVLAGKVNKRLVQLLESHGGKAIGICGLDGGLIKAKKYAQADIGSVGAITDTDATPKGFDGIKRMALGELTFVFRNAAQRICRISNLQASSEALAAIKAGN